MSPVEAGKKTCPFIQNAAVVMFKIPPTNLRDMAESINEHAPANIRCLADSCMAWLWNVQFENDTLEISSTDGYCRLIHEGAI